MKLDVFKTVSLPDPDGGDDARNFKIGETFDSDELTDEKLELYLERGIVGIVGGAEPELAPVVQNIRDGIDLTSPEGGTSRRIREEMNEAEPEPEPKPAVEKATKKATKKATTRRHTKKAGRK